jgi:protein involved in polysaccharide export with SLBB domain
MLPTRWKVMRVSAAILVLFATLCFGWVASAEPYRLMSGDRVDVRVFNRVDLSTTVRIDADGNLRLPFINAVLASGVTMNELEDSLKEAYRSQVGVLDPRVSVSLVETGPVFVVGAVQDAGRYSWETGLTTFKAYALAGGAPRSLEGGSAFVVFEAFRAIEQEQEATVRLAGALLRHSRLAAEASSATDFDAPDGWAGKLSPEQAAGLVERERTLFDRRLAAIEGELAIHARQLDVLGEQERANRAALAKKDEQTALLREELDALDRLDTQRLVATPRLLALRRSIVEVEGDQLDIERRIAESRLEEAAVEQRMLNLRNATVIEAATQLAEVERELIRLEVGARLSEQRADAARLLIGREAFRKLDMPARTSRSEDGLPRFTIRRETEGNVSTIKATGDTMLLPHDLLVVQ